MPKAPGSKEPSSKELRSKEPRLKAAPKGQDITLSKKRKQEEV
jgi:hypothetical protein